MKRLHWLIITAAITAAVIWWSFYRSRHTSSAAVVAFLPRQTLAFAHVPDFNRSRVELRQTDLYRLWTEPAVQAFLQRPREAVPVKPGLGSIVQDCESLQMKDLFVAITKIENSSWKIVAGFRFGGSADNAEEIVAAWRTKLFGRAADVNPETVEHQGHQIQTNTAGVFRLSSARAGQWFLFANDIDPLKGVLDRLDNPARDPDNALAADNIFVAAVKHMPSTYTLFGFGRPNQLVENFGPNLFSDNLESARRRAVVRQIHSLCGAISFDGTRIRDSIFVGMPRLHETGSLTRMSLPGATADGFLYADGILSLTEALPLVDWPALGWIGNPRGMIDDLAARGVTLESWNQAFGSELSWIGNWAPNSHLPSFLVTLPVNDRDKATKLLTSMTEMNGDSPFLSAHEKDGIQFFSANRTGRLFSFSPTIGLSKDILVAGPDPDVIEVAIKRISSKSSGLAASKTFRLAERAVPPARQMFAYIDPALIYTRVDATLRPLLFMGAAFLPGFSDTIDPSKLPPPDTITKHLSPIVMSQRYDGDGYISESVGPITVSQAIVGVGGLGAAAALFYHTNAQRPGFSLPRATSNPAWAPSPSPEPPSPSSSPN